MDTTKYRTTLATCDYAAWLTALAIYDDLPEGHPLEAHAYIAYRKGMECSKEEVMALIELLERPSGSKRVQPDQELQDEFTAWEILSDEALNTTMIWLNSSTGPDARWYVDRNGKWVYR